MSAILLNGFLTKFVTGLLSWSAVIIIFSFVLKWRWRTIQDESEKKKISLNGSSNVHTSGRFFKVDLPVFVVLNLAWYISAAWLFIVSHSALFSSSTTIQSNLNASLNALSFMFALELVLLTAATSFFIIEFSVRLKRIKDLA